MREKHPKSNHAHKGQNCGVAHAHNIGCPSSSVEKLCISVYIRGVSMFDFSLCIEVFVGLFHVQLVSLLCQWFHVQLVSDLKSMKRNDGRGSGLSKLPCRCKP